MSGDEKTENEAPAPVAKEDVENKPDAAPEVTEEKSEDKPSEKPEKENEGVKAEGTEKHDEKKPEEPTGGPDDAKNPATSEANPEPKTPKMKETTEKPKDQETSSTQDGEDDASKADDQSVGDVPNDDGDRTEDAMETEDQSGSRGDAAEEASTSSKAELPYSTRGRSTNDTGSGSGGENWERGALDTLEEIGRAKEHTAPAPLGTSFLEALSEEERRTRTRFLPDVDGMHILRKSEIKDDLALARSLVSASGVTSLKKPKGKRSRNDEDSMDVDDEDAASPSEDDRSSDNAGTAVIPFRSRDLVVPSNAFIAPNEAKGISKDTDMEDRDDQSNTAAGSKAVLQSPSVVESVTAFNPPRPPESIGAKKKHRMLRWERRPEDVEVDLNNYRKTVQRTRQELHSAEAEYNRLETIDAHLRWHYLNHLNLMNEEYLRLNEEFSSAQQECVKAADLLTSRTRSRGAGKGSYVMRDVLTVLKSRGAEGKEKEAMDIDDSRVPSGTTGTAGVGGLTPLAFTDWNRTTNIPPSLPANAWIVPGERVSTPYGDGVVTKVHPAIDIPPGSLSSKRNEKGGNEEKGGESNSGKAGGWPKGSKRKKDMIKQSIQSGENKESNSTKGFAQPARVTVELDYGVGHFGLDTVTSINNPAVLSDAKLSRRWKSLIESALSVSGCLDIQGMSKIIDRAAKDKMDSDSSDVEDSSQVRVGDSNEESEVTNSSDRNAGKDSRERVLPFGSGMLPTSSGRGTALQMLSISDIEEETKSALFEGTGVLGKTTYKGVTEDFRKWEDDETEYLTLQASVLQLRNALVRQKRIRLLNERTSVATTDRYHRAEELVSEMRADLKSLKQRLEQELQELGIDEGTAEQILSSFYNYHIEDEDDDDDDDDDGSEFASKRSRIDQTGTDTAEESFQVSRYGHEAQRESVDGVGMDELSGDDLESHRTTKKMRPNQ